MKTKIFIFFIIVIKMIALGANMTHAKNRHEPINVIVKKIPRQECKTNELQVFNYVQKFFERKDLKIKNKGFPILEITYEDYLVNETKCVYNIRIVLISQLVAEEQKIQKNRDIKSKNILCDYTKLSIDGLLDYQRSLKNELEDAISNCILTMDINVYLDR